MRVLQNVRFVHLNKFWNKFCSCAHGFVQAGTRLHAKLSRECARTSLDGTPFHRLSPISCRNYIVAGAWTTRSVASQPKGVLRVRKSAGHTDVPCGRTPPFCRTVDRAENSLVCCYLEGNLLGSELAEWKGVRGKVRGKRSVPLLPERICAISYLQGGRIAVHVESVDDIVSVS